MEKLFCIYLLTVIFGRTYGLNLPWPQNEKLNEQSCDNNLIDSTVDLSPHSLYYVRPYHCDHHKEHEKSKLISQFNAPSSRSEKNVCTPKWVENVQENRIPRILMTAECDTTCDSVSYALSVLKIDDCELGYSVFRQEIQTISVACVPKSHQSESSDAVPNFSQTESSHLAPSYHVVGSRIKELPTRPKLADRYGISPNSRQMVQEKLEVDYLMDSSSAVPPHHVIRSRIESSPIGENPAERNAITSHETDKNPDKSLMRNSRLIPPYHVVRSRIPGSPTNKRLVERLAVTSDYKLVGPE